MSRIQIRNKTEQHLQYILNHQEVCVKLGRCFCQKTAKGFVAMTVHVPGGKGQLSAHLLSEVAKASAIARDAGGKNAKIEIVAVNETLPKGVMSKAEAIATNREVTEIKPAKKSGGGRKKEKSDDTTMNPQG